MILVIDWPAFGEEKIKRIFKGLGHRVAVFDFSEKSQRIGYDGKTGERIAEAILREKADIVFSFNFFPVIAIAAHACKCRYISWVYDNPTVQLYSMTVFFEENYIFHFDSAEVERLRRDGVEHVWYLPMAADIEGNDSLTPSDEERKKYNADVAMIGSMYNEKTGYFSKYTEFDDYLSGYLEALIAAQEKIYGVNFLEEALTPEIMDRIQKTVPLTDDKGDRYDTAAWDFANYYLAMKVTAGEREHILQAISNRFDVALYTNGATPGLPCVRNMGKVEYYKQAPLAIKCAKINLNVTLRSIRTGIPQRVMDIMSCKGFVLSNYQADLCEAFVPGEDFVYYESIEDAVDKVEYYLDHEEERLRIALNGYTKVKEEHNYGAKCKFMMEKTGINDQL